MDNRDLEYYTTAQQLAKINKSILSTDYIMATTPNYLLNILSNQLKSAFSADRCICNVNDYGDINLTISTVSAIEYDNVAIYVIINNVLKDLLNSFEYKNAISNYLTPEKVSIIQSIYNNGLLEQLIPLIYKVELISSIDGKIFKIILRM